MRIESYGLKMESSFQKERLEITSTRGDGNLAASLMEIKEWGSSAVEVIGDGSESLSPGLQFLKSFIERMTGREVSIYRPSRGGAGSESGALSTNKDSQVLTEGGQSEGATQGGQGIRMVVESQKWDWSVSGKLTTADGRSVSFDLSAQQSSFYAGVETFTTAKDPLVLSLNGQPVSLENGKLPESAAFLVKEDGSRFGPSSGDGFAELAALDEDGNGWIDEGDSIWSKLKLEKENGTNESLASAGIGALFLGAQATPFTHRTGSSITGSTVATSFWLGENGGGGLLQRIDLTA